MKLKNTFIEKIKHLNGQKVHLTIVQITPENYPGGLLSFMMIKGKQQIGRISSSDKEYNGKNGTIELDVIMELIILEEGFYLMFVTDNFENNCIEIFRPEPPMEIHGVDVSLWWSYHPLSQFELNKTKIIKTKYINSTSNLKGDCYPIKDIFVNGISHCI